MHSVNRNFAFGIFAMVVLALGIVSVHVATHLSGDLQTCELCCGHSNPSHALPATGLVFAAASPEPVVRLEPLNPRKAAPQKACHSRDPPAVS